MRTEKKLSLKTILFLGAILTFLILTLDIITPLGFAIYLWYLGVLFLLMLTGQKRFILLAGSVSIALIVIGYFLSTEDPFDDRYFAIINRLLSIALIISAMFGIIKFLDKNEELIKKIDELEIANKELESFNFISSHDLQEPLRKIQNFVSMLQQETNISNDGKYYLRLLTVTSKHMRQLIEDLLEFTRIKKSPPNFEKTNLHTIFEEVITSYRDVLDEKNAILEIKNLCELSIIRPQFRQLISKLLSNSLKFTHPERPLHIIVEGESSYGNKLSPKLSPTKKYCHISFSDNGIGFDPKYRERIFDFFERLHGQEYPGTGFGLAICKKIVQNHRGLITAKSEINNGAQFDIYIPEERA